MKKTTKRKVVNFKKADKSKKGGLTAKGRAKDKHATGGTLQAPVTGKVKPGSKSANRRKSFCSRMKGMKKKLTGSKKANDPNSRINKALKRWKC